MTSLGGVTRYSCPLPGCDWTYDAPEPGLFDVLATLPDREAAAWQSITMSAVEPIMLRHLQAVEAVLADHFAGHSVAEWVIALTHAQQQRAADTTSTWHVEAGCDDRWRPVAGPFPARSIAIADLEWRRTTAPSAVTHRLRRTDTTRTTTVEEA